MVPTVSEDVNFNMPIFSFGAKSAIAPKEKITAERKFGKDSNK